MKLYKNLYKGKHMEKPIIIKPSNSEMAMKIKALSLMNDFITLGFSNRSAFMAIVMHYFPKYKEGKEKNRLSNWYYGKYTDEGLNSDMDIVLNKLRYE
jgi:hypothetical protein